VLHLGERVCSVQRRHQKLIEESPAAPWIVGADLRERIGSVAVAAARAVGYRGAGTVEGLLSGGEYYFLEMNTRVQVEHCVTEMTTGVDIVKTGIRVAAGEALPFTQDEVVLRGHAIECRINAEDAARRFLPTPGRIATYREPAGPGVRVDSGVGPGSEISTSYDPLVAKLIVWDSDRAAATSRMRRALREFEITGLVTLLPFHERLLATEQWARGETCRDLLEDDAWLAGAAQAPESPAAGDGTVTLDYTVEVGGRRFDVRVSGRNNGNAAGAEPRVPRTARRRRESATPGAGGGDALTSPMQGTVLKIAVEAGARVEPGTLIGTVLKIAVEAGARVEPGTLVAIIEAMKMENEVTAHKAGTVAALPIAVGASVATGDVLAVIESP
jgi:acetyl-CoA/propionyl-CoA carboxylase biotin carboxyl carrier protein